VLARGITDGPDEDFEKLRLTSLGAVTCARSSILVVTPYNLPDAALITALNVAVKQANRLPPRPSWFRCCALWFKKRADLIRRSRNQTD